MPDSKKEYVTRFIYRCSNCGKRIEKELEDKDALGFSGGSLRVDLEHAKRQYIHGILILGHNKLSELHKCSDIRWGKLELIGVSILDIVERAHGKEEYSG